MKKKSTLKKKAQTAVIAATATASLITHSVIEEPKTLLELNSPIYEQQYEKKLSPSQKLAKKLYELPTIVKVLLIVPLWIIGYGLSAIIKLLVTPIVIRWVIIGLLALLVITLILHLIFPDKSLKELLTPGNIIITTIGIMILAIGLRYYQKQFPEYYQTFRWLLEFSGSLLIIIIVVCRYYQKNRRVLFIEEQ